MQEILKSCNSHSYDVTFRPALANMLCTFPAGWHYFSLVNYSRIQGERERRVQASFPNCFIIKCYPLWKKILKNAFKWGKCFLKTSFSAYIKHFYHTISKFRQKLFWKPCQIAFLEKFKISTWSIKKARWNWFFFNFFRNSLDPCYFKVL